LLTVSRTVREPRRSGCPHSPMARRAFCCKARAQALQGDQGLDASLAPSETSAKAMHGLSRSPHEARLLASFTRRAEIYWHMRAESVACCLLRSILKPGCRLTSGRPMEPGAATHQAFGVGRFIWRRTPRHRGTERIPAKWRVIARRAASLMSFRQREARAQAAISSFAE
jgi:hypothetical protein